MLASPPVPELPLRLDGTFWGITAYFNPAGYASKRENLMRFCDAARRQRLLLMIVELALGSQPFTVEDSLADRILRVRSNSVLWHKERLLNLAVKTLPADCDKVAWLDGDILFENPDWVAQTGDLLTRYVAVQPFRHAYWLMRGQLSAAPESFSSGIGPGRTLPGMAFAMSRKTDRIRALGNYFHHGHTGFCWAIRRANLQQHGLYDKLILGGGDVVIARAFYDPMEQASNVYPPRLAQSIHKWRQPFYTAIQRSVFYADGGVFHLWHGDNKNRGYNDRMKILAESDFDPALDIQAGSSGCWEWASDKPLLRSQVEAYFRSRREDGA